MIKKIIASNLYLCRTRSNLSLEQFAKVLNIPIESYRNYELAADDIPISTLYQCSVLFKVDLEFFYDGLHEIEMYSSEQGLSIAACNKC